MRPIAIDDSFSSLLHSIFFIFAEITCKKNRVENVFYDEVLGLLAITLKVAEEKGWEIL